MGIHIFALVIAIVAIVLGLYTRAQYNITMFLVSSIILPEEIRKKWKVMGKVVAVTVIFLVGLGIALAISQIFYIVKDCLT